MGIERIKDGVKHRSSEKLMAYLKQRTVYTINNSNHQKIKDQPREKQHFPVRIAMDQEQYEKPFTMICYVVNENGDLLDIRSSQTPIQVWKFTSKETRNENILVHVLDITTQNGPAAAFALKCKEQNKWFIETDGDHWSEIKHWAKGKDDGLF